MATPQLRPYLFFCTRSPLAACLVGPAISGPRGIVGVPGEWGQARVYATRATKKGSNNAAAVRKPGYIHGWRGGRGLSGLLQVPPRSSATFCFVFAHGAGAGMAHPFMAAVADGLAARDIATLRYQFPYMEKRAKRPDPPKIGHAAVRAAVAEAQRQLPDVPLFAGANRSAAG